MAYRPYETENLTAERLPPEDLRHTRPDLAAAYERLDTILDAPDFDIEAFENEIQNIDIYNASGTIPQVLLMKIAGLVASQGHPLNMLFGQQRKNAFTRSTERRRMTQALVLQSQLADIDRRSREIEEKIAENNEEIKRLEAKNVVIEEQIVTKKQERTTIITRELNIPAQQEFALVDANNERFNTIYAGLKEPTQDALNAYENAGEDIITVRHGDSGQRHIAYQGENGYYIKIDGEEIAITDPDEITRIRFQEQNGEAFGNNLSDEKIAEFTAAQTAFFEAINKHENPAVAEQLAQLHADKELIEAEVAALDSNYLSVKADLDRNNREIRELGADLHKNSAKIAHLESENARLSTELEQLTADKAQKIAQQQALLEEKYEKLQDLLAKLDTEIAETAEITEDKQAFDAAFASAIDADQVDRHRFIRGNMGVTPVGFWSRTVMHGEDAVYHDYNSTDPAQKLYTLARDDENNIIKDPETGHPVRIYIEDPNVVARLMRQAWDPENMHSFGNETPRHNKDSANTMGDTMSAAARIEDAQTVVATSYQKQSEQQKTACEQARSAASELDGEPPIQVESCSPSFNSAGGFTSVTAADPENDPEFSADAGAPPESFWERGKDAVSSWINRW